MKLYFKLHLLFQKSPQIFNRADLSFSEGSRVRFTYNAQRILRSFTDDKSHTVIKLDNGDGGHFIALLSNNEWYDCSWLTINGKYKKL